MRYRLETGFNSITKYLEIQNTLHFYYDCVLEK